MKTNKLFATMLALLCVIGISGCDKEDTEPGTESALNTDLYFEADMNGKSLFLPEGKDGYVSEAGAYYGPAKTTGCVSRQAMRLKGADMRKSLEVSFIKWSETCIKSCSQVEEMFKVSSYTFGNLETTSDERVIDGVLIRYTDVDGKVWSSDFGSGDQTGSSFRIVEHISNTKDKNSKKITTTEFSAKLYDGNGNKIDLTNGKMMSRSVVCE
ncbi:hypothetical protein [Pontibacter anaerobius]|uniref:Lipoprotein n=1 Tax=Pontibacter anaerobius TaxID=2993940 RepID=A0ABT3RKU0_9BACT|nr:hypothetical protein [Pontibacter anaerobius]MCX2742186.1 hypothetical protein [Pontibacter anaerobius]